MDSGGISFFKIMHPQQLSINDFDYNLPETQIALHPLKERDASQLLVYKNQQISSATFAAIDQYLPDDALLIFNNTKVINARIKFVKPTGAVIEVFCLEPVGTFTDYAMVMASNQTVQWKCLVGGAAKWKDEVLQKTMEIDGKTVVLSATKIEKITEAFIISFSWTPNEVSFATIIEAAGTVPLPPYIKRQTADADTERYQTIFAENSGSVAAPTAGLHFSEAVFEKLSAKGCAKAFVTLHVGAGTFKPVKAATMAAHEMHAEYIDVTIPAIQQIIQQLGNIVAVGTTSLRTIESLYWLGVKIIVEQPSSMPTIYQWDVYEPPLKDVTISAKESLQALVNWMQAHQQKHLFTKTQILIAPGYQFKIANMLVTNFHQPKSTLLLLVAAAIGDDWKLLYEYALKNEFRFLSYGDANLIYLNQAKG
ncbi:S-adenosylmethionine:tRNA ribosyltransferase-isomerase [Ferruginibacter yonginensis]|uniref:S-adenosylmethionine:tRNA ribosyltransferase-isomerase n=1 Tax=Ferruginibacter yonginensis TaxID=1310416 RepID=A0ABV8QR67_9BACT